MRVAILYGGKSGEHEVSIRSAASVIRNIDKRHRLQLIGITKKGTWHLQPDCVLASCLEGEDPLELRADAPSVVVVPGVGLRVYGARGSADLQLDAIFPVLHGTFGEDGTIQGLLESANAAYVGADVLGSALGMDKEIAKAVWRDAGLPVVPSITVRSIDVEHIDQIIQKIDDFFSWPVFVKPARCGSSVGASKIDSSTGLASALKAALNYDSKALIEPFLVAREIECSVLGNDNPRAFLPGELIPSHEFYDYEAKYIDPEGAAIVIPAHLDAATIQLVMQLAVKAYVKAGLSGMARVDFFIGKNDNTIYINEANTIPGFTSISMFPMMCEHGGLSYTALIEELLDLAIERKKAKATLSFDR